jgi:long-chain acyl-CoA synthetase
LQENSVKTLAELPFYVLERFPKPALIRRCVGEGYHDFSSRDYFDQIRYLSFALPALGLERGDRAAIISESRPEWGIADLAIVTAGGVDVPIYPTLSASQTRYILLDSGARLAIVSDWVQAAKLRQIGGDVPGLAAIIVFDWSEPGEGVDPAAKPRVISMAEALELGRQRFESDPDGAGAHRRQAGSIAPGDMATVIYTSGTTGEPKGVMLSHENLLSNVRSSQDVLELSPADIALSILPLSHSYERIAFYQYLNHGVTVAFAESLQTIARDLARVKPTVLVGVPRVFEKFHSAVMERIASSSALRRRLFEWALPVGHAWFRARLEGRRPGLSLGLRHSIADRLVFAKIRDRVGGRLRYLISGSAPLAEQTEVFFAAAGMPIAQGYGLTEASPILTANPPDAPRAGSVGKPLPRVEIRIAEDGEILARGPNIMLGYFGKPAATREVLDDDGWLHTGDIGHFDADGYLAITDRKKEILVTAGGKNIAPQPIENRLRSSRLVAEAVLIGDRRNFPAVLIVPDFDALRNRFKEEPWASEAAESLVGRPGVMKAYEQLLDAVNEDLAQFERIKRIALLPRAFSIESGELTPTMKPRRKVIETQWRDLIEALYRKPVS